MNKLPVILGIDPGLDGGLCLMSPNGILPPLILGTIPIPTLPGDKRLIDLPLLRQQILDYAPDIVILEQVGSMPGQGVTSMFSFGYSFGAIQGLLVGLQIPVRLVRPQEWQRVAFKGIPATLNKPSTLLAPRLWPSVDWRKSARSRLPHDGMTDE